MAPLIHCVRHAQGFHNLGDENWGMIDPLLTPAGERQCDELRAAFPFHSSVQLVVASPLRRTIYTALHAFVPVFERNRESKLIALPDLQEVSDLPCDSGSDLETLEKEVLENNLPVDLSLVSSGWHVKTRRYAPDDEAIRARARDARRWLKARPEKEIVLVAHGGLLHFLTEDWEDGSVYAGTGWANMEYRSYRYTEEDGNNSTLVETDASRQSRGKFGSRPTRERQKELYDLCRKQWDRDGVQLSAALRESGCFPRNPTDKISQSAFPIRSSAVDIRMDKPLQILFDFVENEEQCPCSSLRGVPHQKIVKNANFVALNVTAVFPDARNAQSVAWNVPATGSKLDGPKELQDVQHQLDIPPSPSNPSLLDPQTPHAPQLLQYFMERVARRLAWIDGPENPWRHVVLPLLDGSETVLSSVLALTAHDMASQYPSGDVWYDKFQRISKTYQNKALGLLAGELSILLLASAIILCNAELLTAQESGWRVHLQAAREVTRAETGRLLLQQQTDRIEEFFLQEFYATSVWAHLTTFHEIDEIVQTPLAGSRDAVFTDLIRIIHQITQAERVKARAELLQLPPPDLIPCVDIHVQLELARRSAVCLGQSIQFWSDHDKRAFEHLVWMYFHASLIYSYQALADPRTCQTLIQRSRNAILTNLHSLSGTGNELFAQNLVWPLFIAGTELRGNRPSQKLIDRHLTNVMRISRTIHLDEGAELSSLNVSLIQTILLDNERHLTGNHIHEQRHSRKRFQRQKKKKPQGSGNLEKSSFTTGILHCNLSASSTSNEVCVREFILSIPCDIPESTQRPSFTISYELVVSATTISGRDLTTRQNLSISRLRIPGPQEVFRYIRTFPETRLRAELILCPQLLSCHGQDRDKHISAQLVLRDVSTAGPRHGELTMVVVKELTWRVDEIEKWNIQQTEAGPANRQKRTIATGGPKGRWPGTRTSAGDIGVADRRIAIPFDITIDSSADALNDFEADHSRATPLLTVKHRLTISIMTGSETKTGSLVDKRDTVCVLGATVPIPLHEYAEESMVSERLEASDAMLPQYDGATGSPPSYSELLQRCI
ncbi:hypothetical protein SI65_05990 [Aspergillus cristatus]|uniref:Uncharacterized protein n=1 Tax=Aspergillus cristatus TaxID=573508 RepID=A0A1E3BEI8_ASPCR|nr:hypothetical protein SI65_05990 [Aspergillus cristatus]